MNALNRWTLGAVAFAALAAGIAFGVGGAPTPQAELTDSNGAAGDGFGLEVALSGDTALVGSASKNSGQGAAFVFTRTGATWTQQAELTASVGAGGVGFGHSVALDGDTAVVGEFGKGSGQGAVCVFTRTGTTWTQQARLTASDGGTADDRFGNSVTLAGDTVAIGASGQNSGQGAAYVFTRTGTTWTRQAKLTASDGVGGVSAFDGDYFGNSVALAGDTAVVGALGKNSDQGAAYVFTRTGTTWTQQAELTASDGSYDDSFGCWVAVAGNTAVVGAFQKDAYRGAAYVFTRTGRTWTQQAELTASNGVGHDDNGSVGDRFGEPIALAGDRLIVGAIGKNTYEGAAYVFARTGTNWTEQAELTASGGAYQEYGSVALAGDTALVGAIGTNSFQGSAYVYALPPTPPPPVGYCLPTKATARMNAAHPEKSSLTASGILDTGGGVPDFSGAATFDVGGFHLVVPAFVAKGKTLTYGAGGITLTVAPARNGSSRATFSVKVVGDLAGKVGLDAPLDFDFTNAANHLNGTRNLAAGVLAPHGASSPDMFVRGAAATLRGDGKDALKLRLAFATDGVVPAAPEDVTISFGDTYAAALPAGGFIRRGRIYIRRAVPRASIDYARGTITLDVRGASLGAFAEGPSAVTVALIRNGVVSSTQIRMIRAGSTLRY